MNKNQKCTSLVLSLLIPLCGLTFAQAQESDEPEDPVSFKPKEVMVDRNFDGEVDQVEYYAQDGTLLKRETDTKFSGTMDQTVYFEDNVVQKAEKDNRPSRYFRRK